MLWQSPNAFIQNILILLLLSLLIRVESHSSNEPSLKYRLIPSQLPCQTRRLCLQTEKNPPQTVGYCTYNTGYECVVINVALMKVLKAVLANMTNLCRFKNALLKDPLLAPLPFFFAIKLFSA